MDGLPSSTRNTSVEETNCTDVPQLRRSPLSVCRSLLQLAPTPAASPARWCEVIATINARRLITVILNKLHILYTDLRRLSVFELVSRRGARHLIARVSTAALRQQTLWRTVWTPSRNRACHRTLRLRLRIAHPHFGPGFHRLGCLVDRRFPLAHSAFMFFNGS